MYILSIAGAISTKYVGLFIYLYVGLHTIGSLWSILGDRAASLLDFAKYFAANFFCLILGERERKVTTAKAKD
jgi:dolichyl-phosphate-mannose--protein O-mannosyl transferase